MLNLRTVPTLFCAAWLCATCTHTLAADPTACGHLKLAFYEHGALYYKNENGDYSGIDTDVVDELARRTGCQFDTVLESRVRIWKQMESNLLDLTVSGIPNEERRTYANFFLYISSKNYVLLQSDLPATAQTLKGFEDDSSLCLAVIKSFSYGAQFDLWLDKLRASQRVIEVADFETLLRVFMVRRVQAIIALPTSWSPQQKHADFRQHVLIKDWLPSNTVDAGLVLSKKRVSKTQADLLEKARQDMQNDGSLLKIFKQHVNPDIAEDLLINPHR